jgi:hypothetical protein
MKTVDITKLMLSSVRAMACNAIFINISAISWRSVLLVEDSGVHGKHGPAACH